MIRDLPSGYLCQVFDELGSTNLEAKHQLRSGLSQPKWILTRRQTAGYGRQGRSWSQGEGDFAGSLVVPIDRLRLFDELAVTSFASALAVDRALQDCGVHSNDLALKWPNDVLLKGGKLAGLLLELVEHEGRRSLILGVGVNIASAPVIEAYKTARLADYMPADKIPTQEGFLPILDKHLMEQLQTLSSTGFAPIRLAWLDRAFGIGGQITVRLQRSEHTGIFEGIDENGALILREGTIVHHINSGDVFFLSA